MAECTASGQLKETHVVKIVAKDTIDEWLVQMQREKQKAISKALQEGTEHKTSPSLEELFRLFGGAATRNEDDEVVLAPEEEGGDEMLDGGEEGEAGESRSVEGT